MNKKRLRSLPELLATPEMIKSAEGETPTKCTYSRRLSYKKEIYGRVSVNDEILAIALFQPKYLRAGSPVPRFTIFFDRSKAQFITFDYYEKKWLTAMYVNLPFETYIGNETINATEEDIKKANEYFSTTDELYHAICHFQYDIREKALIARHKKQTDPWDKDMALVPSPPKDWEKWIDKVGTSQNYIFYNYEKNGAKKGWCSWCEKDVPISKPKHNGVGKCKCCGHSITFKAIGKTGFFYTDAERTYLMQKIPSGFVIREFYCRKTYRRGLYKLPEKSYSEIRRTLYDTKLTPRAYFYGLYKQTETRWIATCPTSSGYGCFSTEGKTYSRNLSSLNNLLCRTGLIEMIKSGIKCDPETYLATLKDFPLLEQLSKAGLTTLADEAMKYHYDNDFATGKGELAKIIGIDRYRLSRLKANNGGKAFQKWLKYEKSADKVIPDKVIKWYCDNKLDYENISFVLDRMSEISICNYIRKQMTRYSAPAEWVITEWHDYLKMAQRLGYDINDAMIYKVNELQKRHDEAVAKLKDKDAVLTAAEMAEKYPEIDTICASLKDKYEYEDDTFAIVTPKRIEDIILDGRALNHCSGTSERYYDRIQSHETYLLFLRKSAEKDKPYYTLEVEPDGTIRQKRTMNDRQNDDIAEATVFLRKWQKEISKRLKDEDAKLATESEKARKSEYEELRKKKVKINGTHLHGQLMADVFESDLLENIYFKRRA